MSGRVLGGYLPLKQAYINRMYPGPLKDAKNGTPPYEPITTLGN